MGIGALKRAVEAWRSLGYEPQLGFEMEFYVMQPDGTLLALPHTAITSSFDFGASEAGDVHFGVSQVGTWQAQVVISGTLAVSSRPACSLRESAEKISSSKF